MILSVVVIGKNEEINLPKVFASIKKANKVFKLQFKEDVEVIYVDSNSIDNSISIANDFGCEIIKISGKTSPAIGRQKGLLSSKGDYVFFLDGDTEVELNWLLDGVDFLKKNPEFSGVGGLLDFSVYNENKVCIWNNSNYWNTKKNFEEIKDGVGGTFLYLKKDLIDVGGFDNSYSIGEEFQLMLKLIFAEKKICRIIKKMAIHHDQKSYRESFVKRYLFTRNIFIPGQIIRNVDYNNEVFSVVIKRYWLTLIHFPILMLAIALLIFNHYYSFLALVFLIFILNLVYKDFNIKRSILSMISMNFYSFGFVYGFFFKKIK